MNEWPTGSLSRHSSFSGLPFENNETVVCFLFREDSGNQLKRIDIKLSEENNDATPKNIIARWTSIFKKADTNSGKESKAKAYNCAESCFLALKEENNDEESYDKKVLKQLLALFLERKGILKRKSSDAKDYLLYWHKASNQVFQVPLGIEIDCCKQAEFEKVLKALIC